MITRKQIRGALAMLNWSLARLSEETKAASVNALSAFLREGSEVSMGYDRVAKIEAALLKSGAEFGEPNWVNVREAGMKSKASRKN